MPVQIEARRLSGADLGKTVTVPSEDEPVTIIEVDHSRLSTFVVYRDKSGRTWTAHLAPTDTLTITGKPSN